MSSSEEIESINVLIIGSPGCGKTKFCERIITNQFLENIDPMVEDEHRKEFTIDNEKYILNIKDGRMDEEFNWKMQYQMHIRESNIFLNLFSVQSDEEQLESCTSWHDLIKNIKNNHEKYIEMVVATRVDHDLHEKNRKISSEIGQNYANSINCEYIETSAKSNLNCLQTIQMAVRQYRELTKNNEPVEQQQQCCKIL